MKQGNNVTTVTYLKITTRHVVPVLPEDIQAMVANDLTWDGYPSEVEIVNAADPSK